MTRMFHHMGNDNSLEMYISLFERLLLDIADSYTDSEPVRDLQTCRSRIDREGISFLTKSLPRLGKAFDKALQGKDPFNPVGLKKSRGTNTPLLLGWLFKRVFADDGLISLTADVNAIAHTRQLLYFLYKLELPYEEETSNDVLHSFISVEEELKTLVLDPKDAVIKRSRGIICRVLTDSDPRDIIPKHGPGSVATGELGGEKTHFSRIYSCLEAEYPFTEYFQLPTQIVDCYRNYESLESLDIATAKVVLVPKDSRGPRLISCEPLELQWIQQGLQRKLYSLIESNWVTAGRVNFRDQTVNRELALTSSLSGEYVTLDMKDASDRVSLQLVEQLFQGTKWLSGLLASRSQETRLPDGRKVWLQKFAPMGSAVCFPVEALCFYALAISVQCIYGRVRFSEAIAHTFVYGDDIIVRREVYALLLQHFPRFGLMFNESKCCVAGFFRESCGCDAFAGIDVTPVKLKTTWHHSKPSPAALKSYCELHNSLYAKGHSRVCAYIREMVEFRFGPLPDLAYKVTSNSGIPTSYTPPGQVIGWFRPDVNPYLSNSSRGIRMRWNASLHRDEVFGYSVTAVHKNYRVTGWEACLRTLVSGSTGLPTGTYAVAHCSRAKRTWGALGTDGYLTSIYWPYSHPKRKTASRTVRSANTIRGAS